jgi:hypothetical protein
MEKAYPIDIKGIRSIGIKEWLNNYYVPVSSSEFNDISKSATSIYTSTLNKFNSSGIFYHLGIANYKLPDRISQNLLNLLRLRRLREKGYMYIVGSKKESINDVINQYEFNLLPKHTNPKTILDKLTRKERVKNVIRSIRYNLKAESINKCFIKNINNPIFFVGDRSQKEVVGYCREENIYPIHISPLLFGKNIYSKSDINPYMSDIHDFCSVFMDLMKKQFEVLTTSHCKSLKDEIEELFTYSLIFFIHNVKFLSKLNNATLLVTGLGNSIHRLFSVAWRYSGGKVIGFTHGNSFYRNYFIGNYIYLSLVDQYVTASAESAKSMQDASKDFTVNIERGEAIYTKQNHYRALFGELQKLPHDKKINKVMLVGFPMASFYYKYIPAGYAYAHLELEIQLLRLLKSAGYQTIYKPHPFTANDTTSLLNEYADEIQNGSFEDVYHLANCILFGEFMSTTFGFAMLTNKPMVLVNVEGHIISKEAFELLKKRCCVVSAEEIEGVISFNDNELLNAVELSLSNINYDIIHKFAFSSYG